MDVEAAEVAADDVWLALAAVEESAGFGGESDAMSASIGSIATHVANESTILFHSTPRYLPGSIVPFRVDISIFGDNDWSAAAQFLVG